MNDFVEEDWGGTLPDVDFGAAPELPPAPGMSAPVMDVPQPQQAPVNQMQQPMAPQSQEPPRMLAPASQDRSMIPQYRRPMQSLGSDFANTGYVRVSPQVQSWQTNQERELGKDKDEEVVNSGHMLGLSILCAGIGGGLGAYFGGRWGFLAGSLFGGAAVNSFRALSYLKEGDEDADKEAVISGTYALVTTGLGIYIWVKAVSSSDESTDISSEPPKMKANIDEKKENMSVVPCDIRPVD